MSSQQQALVTGASRGIGAAIAKALVERGYTVFGLARWQQAQDSVPDKLQPIVVDLADLEQTADTVRQLCKQHSIDTVILNAGRGDIAPLENISAASIGPSLMLNLASPLVVARECLVSLRKAERADLVFIGSESALKGGRQGSLYSAAKFGLRGAAQALREELAGANVHVGIVQPGLTRTGFFDALDFEPGADDSHALQPDDIVAAVLSMLDSSDQAIVDEIVVKPRHNVITRKR